MRIKEELEPGTVKSNQPIDEDLHNEAKRRAKIQRVKIANVYNKALEEYFDRHPFPRTANEK